MRVVAARGLARPWRAARLALAACALVACEDVTPTVWTRAPGNLCPEHACDRYEQDGTRPQCSDGRCEVLGRPDYPITLVIDVPDSSFFGAGHTFVLRSGDPPNRPTADCPAATCLRLPPLVAVGGSYAFTSDAARRVGQPFGAAESSLPATVRLVPLAVQDEPLLPSQLSLPLEPLRGQTGAVAASPGDPLAFEYVRNLPAGRYLRVVEPARPLDEAFPPFASQLDVRSSGVASGSLRDDVLVGGQDLPLDDPNGVARTATVRRAAGLDGFRVWLADARTAQRVSSLRSLAGVEARVRLDTVGQSAPGTSALRDGIEIVVAPPVGAVAVPRLVSPLLAGLGLLVDYPALSAPVEIAGRVLDAPESSTGAQAEVTFRSKEIRASAGAPNVLLKYQTVVATDAEGRFATVLPRGRYDVVVDADPSRGLARTSLELGVETASAAVELVPARRTRVAGRVVITDGRPLVEADVVFAASARARAGSSPGTSPRPVSVRADEDGRFVADVDPGEHDVAVVPRAGTGLPRLVLPNVALGGPEADLGEVRVPAPVRYAFVVRDPFENRVARATVRAFAVPVGGSVPVEIGLARTDGEGRFELLLAGRPR